MTGKTVSSPLFAVVLIMLLVAVTPAAQSQSPSSQVHPANGVSVTVDITSRPLGHPEPTVAIQPPVVGAAGTETPLLPSAPTWKLLMSEDFEGEFPAAGWTVYDWYSPDGEQYWGKDDFNPHTGGWSAWCAAGGEDGLDPEYNSYPDNAISLTTYGPFSLLVYSDAVLTFSLWLESEPVSDYFAVLASTDDILYAGILESGSSGGWEYWNVDLADWPTLGNLIGRPQVWIAFLFLSNDSVTAQGAFVDDVELWAHSHNVFLPLVLR